MNREELIRRLAQAGIKHTPENILRIVERADGLIVFLETGNAESGWQHIIDNRQRNFADRGISEDQIADAIIEAILHGVAIGIQGKSRTVYQVEFNGKLQYISIEIASNGYIVGANPTSTYLVRRLLQRL